jgi:phosphoribosylcarboxyaminoimidazole (NCAIR) mutase
MKFDVIFGSTSDEEKVLPGIVRATKDIPGLEVMVHYASADNTPNKVQELMQFLAEDVESREIMLQDEYHRVEKEKNDPTSPWLYALAKKECKDGKISLGRFEGRRVFISGAGMSNVLTGVVKTYARPEDVVIGIPITDNSTRGMSALLSTSEKPLLNPVLTVGLDNSYAAFNIAYRILQGFDPEKGVVIAGSSTGDIKPEGIVELEKVLTSMGIKYTHVSNIVYEGEGDAFDEDVVGARVADVKPDDLVISVFDYGSYLSHIDEKLRKGKGIQIGVFPHPPKEDFNSYLKHCKLDGTETTGIVGAQSYENAAVIAAQILQHGKALGYIFNKKHGEDGRATKLEKHQGLYVVNGEVKKL